MTLGNNHMPLSKVILRLALYLSVYAICMLILYPYFVMLCTALKSRAEIFSVNGTVFPIVWTITKGDPASRTDTLVTYLYKLAFYNGKQGEAAAVSVIGFCILLICATVYMVSTLKKGED